MLKNIQKCLVCVIWFMYLYSTINNKNKPLIFYKMKTIIETLTTAKQVATEGRTYVKDCNSTIVRINEFGFKFFVTKHDYQMESKKFKTFNGAWSYAYKN